MGVYRHGLIGSALLGLCLSLTSCLFANDIEDTDASPQIIRSVDDTNQLVAAEEDLLVVLPEGWQEAPEKSLNASADLYAQNPDEDLYLVVVGESEASIQAGSEELIAYRYRQLILEALDSYQEPTATQADSVGGYPTIQYEIRGRLDDQEVVYLHTTVFVEDMVYQVVGWSDEAGYAQHQDELQRIISSFRPV